MRKWVVKGDIGPGAAFGGPRAGKMVSARESRACGAALGPPRCASMFAAAVLLHPNPCGVLIPVAGSRIRQRPLSRALSLDNGVPTGMTRLRCALGASSLRADVRSRRAAAVEPLRGSHPRVRDPKTTTPAFAGAVAG